MTRKSTAKKRASKKEKSEIVSNGGKTASTVKEQSSERKPWQFQPGQSGNPAGRKPGSRNRLSENFLKAMADDFDEHGVEAITKVRQDDPAKYLTVVAQLVPKETDINVKTDETFVALWKAVATGAVTSMLSGLDDDGEEAFH